MSAFTVVTFVASFVAGAGAYAVWTRRQQRTFYDGLVDRLRLQDGMFDDAGGWAVVELFGHVKFGAHVQSVFVAGSRRMRCVIPGLDPLDGGTQFIGASSCFRLTRCSEQHATEVAEDEIARWKRWGAGAVVPFLHHAEEPAPTSSGTPSAADPQRKDVCSECGTEWPDGATAFPRCGCEDVAEAEDIPF